MKTAYQTTTPEETKQIGAKFARELSGGEVVFLRGDLGSGKTTFVQGLARALGYEGPVRSPTFTLVNVYPTDHPTIRRIVHVDLYRLEEVSELTPLALEEYLDAGTVMLVEWPDLLKPLFQKPDFEVNCHAKQNIHVLSW